MPSTACSVSRTMKLLPWLGFRRLKACETFVDLHLCLVELHLLRHGHAK